MYLATNVEILFPENRGRKAIKFKSVSSFKIESSWANLTDTAEIIVAKILEISPTELKYVVVIMVLFTMSLKALYPKY